MGIEVGELRFLAFARPVSSVSHYVHFAVPKKRGGERVISAPMPRLKKAQRWVLDHLLSSIPVHDAAHGFVSERSIVTNATPHVGAEVVVNCDIKDFFPSVTYPRVKGVWRSLGYGEAVSTILALVCTAPKTTQVELDGRRFFVAQGARHLPQGAPTSPALTNIICRGLDARLDGMSKAYGYTYTRYADDMTLSAADEEAVGLLGKMMGGARFVVEDEGFVLHPDKTRVLRRGVQQEVTGVVVNEKLSVSRRVLRRFRALLFQIERDGPEGKSWSARPGEDVLATIDGFCAFVQMVDPRRGAILRPRVDTILQAHAYQRPHPTVAALPIDDRVEEAPVDPSKKEWWKMW